VSQPPFVHNFPNLPQQLNQNMVLPNGQYGFPNMNQLVPLQMPTSSQVGPYGIPPYLLGGLNQLPQATVPQNPNFMANLKFGLVHCNQVGQQGNQNQQNLAPPTTDANALKPSPIAAPQLQGNSSAPLNHCPVQPSSLRTCKLLFSQGHRYFYVALSTWIVGQIISLGKNPFKNGGINAASSNWKNSPSKNFTMNPKRGEPQQGYVFFFWITFVSIILLSKLWTGCLQFKIICGSQKSQFHHMKNEKRKFGFPNEQKGKGLWFYTLLLRYV
jgi:hypothetical protein